MLMLVSPHFVVQLDAVDGVDGPPVVRQFGVVLGEGQDFLVLGGHLVAEVADFDLLLLDPGGFVLDVLLGLLEVLEGLFVVVAELVEAGFDRLVVDRQLSEGAEQNLEFFGIRLTHFAG